MAENDGWEPIHPAAHDDGWEPITLAQTSTAPIGDLPPDFGDAKVTPEDVQHLGALFKGAGEAGLTTASGVVSPVIAGGAGLLTGAANPILQVTGHQPIDPANVVRKVAWRVTTAWILRSNAACLSSPCKRKASGAL